MLSPSRKEPYMDAITREYLCRRLDEIICGLKETNPHYALENDICNRLYESIEPILLHDGDLTICAGDCANLYEYLEHETARDAIIQEELYLQGYLDCVRLLSMLKILPCAL